MSGISNPALIPTPPPADAAPHAVTTSATAPVPAPLPSPPPPTPPPQARDWLDWWKDVSSTVQSIATVLALLVGAWWFERQGFVFPHANSVQTLQTLKIHGNWRLVRLSVRVSNVGSVPITLDAGTVYIARVYPLEDSVRDLINAGGSPIDQSRGQIPWPLIGNPYNVTPHATLWPSESESYDFDFLIPTNLCEIMAYSRFVNESNKKLVWSASTLQSLEDCEK
jgi:hypothetical protein